MLSATVAEYQKIEMRNKVKEVRLGLSLSTGVAIRTPKMTVTIARASRNAVFEVP